MQRTEEIVHGLRVKARRMIPGASRLNEWPVLNSGSHSFITSGAPENHRFPRKHLPL